MNSLQRALYRDLSTILADQRMPDGRQLTEAQWWMTLNVAETIVFDPFVRWENRYAHPVERPPADVSPGSAGAPR